MEVYSFDNENFYELEDLLAQIKVGADIEKVYKGTKVPYTHADFICGKEIIESIQNRAYDKSEEYSGNYISQFDDKSKTEHNDAHLVIERLISDYLNKTMNQPDFFKVENVEEVLFSELQSK